MGLFDSVAGAILGKLGGESGNPMLQIAMNLLNENGGLSGVLDKFKESGLTEEAASWVSKGENMPISAEQITQVLGSGAVADMAAKFGLSSEDISGKLAEYLPGVVDQLTPDGEVPSDMSNIMGQLMGMLKA